MSKVADKGVEVLPGPFSGPLMTDEERAMAALERNGGREVVTKPIPSAPKVTKSTHDDAAKELSTKIHLKAAKVVLATLRYQDTDQSDMDEEEVRIAKDAKETDKNVPFGVKAALKTFESFQKQKESDERPALAIQINFGGEPIAYPRRTVEED